jgi:hypothetical protein
MRMKWSQCKESWPVSNSESTEWEPSTLCSSLGLIGCVSIMAALLGEDPSRERSKLLEEWRLAEAPVDSGFRFLLRESRLKSLEKMRLSFPLRICL